MILLELLFLATVVWLSLDMMVHMDEEFTHFWTRRAIRWLWKTLKIGAWNALAWMERRHDEP